MRSQHEINSEQYQDKSTAYLYSSVHAQGIEFDKIQQLLRQKPVHTVLDLGCGGGHVTYHIAPFVPQVIAYDLTPTMVQTVHEQAQARGLNNVQTMIGCAEQLPFEDKSLDMIISRYSAHHWQHIGQAMTEICRVLKPTGTLILIDIVGHDNPILDTFLQSIELIRDPSHVRDYSMSEWLKMTTEQGLSIDTIDIQTLPLSLQSWVERMNTPVHARETIRYLQSKASDSVRQHFCIDKDGNFTSQVIYLVATMPQC